MEGNEWKTWLNNRAGKKQKMDSVDKKMMFEVDELRGVTWWKGVSGRLHGV